MSWEDVYWLLGGLLTGFFLSCVWTISNSLRTIAKHYDRV